jgi:hypothetical protein
MMAESDLVTTEWDGDGLRDMRNGHSLFVRDVNGKRMGFAVHNEGAFAGLAVVSGINGTVNVESERLIDLAGFAVAMLEEQVSGDKKQKPAILQRAEENLILQDNKKNVVPLRPARLMDDPWTVLPTPKATVVSTLVIAKPGFPFQRLGIDVHVRSGRVAFLPIKDLPAESLSSVISIRELGSITIFVEEISNLSVEQQAQLAEFLRLQPDEDQPVVLACTTSTLEDLLIDGKLDKNLAQQLMQVRIPWNPQDTDAVTVKKAVRIVIDGADSVAPETRYVPFHAKFLDEDQPTFH